MPDQLQPRLEEYSRLYIERYDNQLTRLTEYFEVAFNSAKSEMVEKEQVPLLQRLGQFHSFSFFKIHSRKNFRLPSQ